MCLLIMIRDFDPHYPTVVASNRDESRLRVASPPGLFVASTTRILSPRDRRAGGTWLGLNDRSVFAGITNVAADQDQPRDTSRGELPHLALDHVDLSDGIAAVRERCAQAEFNSFQLLVADGSRAVVLRQSSGTLEESVAEERIVVLSNEHGLGELELDRLTDVLAPGLSFDQRIGELKAVLLDEGESGGHRVLKRGGEFGTVSSSILAIPRADVGSLLWLYAQGDPAVTAYRNYGNLGRRLLG